MKKSTLSATMILSLITWVKVKIITEFTQIGFTSLLRCMIGQSRYNRIEERRKESAWMFIMAAEQAAAVSMLRCFKVTMVEMMSLEEMDVMDCLVLKDPKDL